MKVIRATKTSEQAGAYYVRIQAMARKHQIPLDVEFDEHDTPDTKYIVMVDEYLPVATCRMYAIDGERVMLGRVVVLPEYRRQGLGTQVMKEAETWARELGYKKAVVESRDNKIHFYETMGYAADYSQKITGETFTCYRMEKDMEEEKIGPQHYNADEGAPRNIWSRIRRWLQSLSFRTGVTVLLCCIPFYILSFAQMLLPISAVTKGVLWTVLFGLAKTCQYGGLTILGVEGYRRLKNKISGWKK